MTSALLDGIVVCVLTGDPAAAVAARHLEQLGATVFGIERPDADVVLVDAGSDPSADCTATALVCTFESQRVDGGLIASETTAQAAIGFTGYVGPADGPPARIGSDVGTAVAGISAVQGTLAWLHGGRVTLARHDIAVSPLRALSTLKTIIWAARTRPDQWVGTHVRSRDRLVDSGYRTRDGRITLDFPVGAEDRWGRLADELGLDASTIERLQPRWHETVGWGDDVDDARPVYEERLSSLSTEDAVALIRRNGGSSVPFQTLEECLDHPQSRALGLRERGAYGLPFRLDPAGRLRVAASSSRDPARPLADVRVVDFGVGGVGPFAATLLAWLGADVVKVEAPNEFILSVRPTVAGLSTTYLALNQGKRSVRLDLKDAADRELARELVSGADVVLENFRPGALDRIGFGFEELSTLNPRLVYCSVTGFGSVGPLASEPCTDPHMQAFSGFASENADKMGLPRRLRYYGFVDLVTSTVATEAVCAALLARATVGGPVRVETSMLEAVTHVLQASRDSTAHEHDGLYGTRDGNLAVTCRSVEEVAALADVLRVSSLTDAGLEEIFGTRSAAEWAQLLGERGVPSAQALRDEDVLRRRDFREAGLLRDLPLPDAEPLIAGGPPWSLGDQGQSPAAPAPGQDTERFRIDPGSFWRPRPESG